MRREVWTGLAAPEIGGLLIEGVPAWLAWRVVHLAKITSFRNQLATALDWSLGYFYDQNTARLEVQPSGAAAAHSHATSHG